MIEEYSASVQFRNTWGDGLYLVLDDVGAAAQCALACQDTMRALDTDLLGLPPLLLRVGAHAVPGSKA